MDLGKGNGNPKLEVSANYILKPFSCLLSNWFLQFPDGSAGKESACNAGDAGLIPGWGRFPGGRNGNPFQYSCLRKPMDRGSWQATVQRVARSRTRLSTPTQSSSYNHPKNSFCIYTVVSWMIQVRTVLVHLHVDFFKIVNTIILNDPQLNLWIQMHRHRGSTLKLLKDFPLSRRWGLKSPCCLRATVFQILEGKLLQIIHPSFR